MKKVGVLLVVFGIILVLSLSFVSASWLSDLKIWIKNVFYKPQLSPEVSSIDLSKGLIAHYKFDEDARDFSGNKNDGKVYGLALTKDGKFGSAYEFPGISDKYIETPISHVLSSDTKTISAWVKKFGGDLGAIFGTSGPLINLYMSSNAIRYEWKGDVDGVYGTQYTEPCSLSDEEIGKWLHIVGIMSTTNLIIYKNGVLCKDNLIPIQSRMDKGNILIGSYLGYNFMFRGIIDEVKIYDRALNKEEIKQLYEGIQTCEEKWQCSEWSSCSDGKQTRTCTDLNKCGTEKNKPATSQACCVVNCIGKECGDDGCGGSCGKCETGKKCVNYKCISEVLCTDKDKDGFSVEGGSCGKVDCNDNDASINPNAKEICDNKKDDNCDGKVDEGCGVAPLPSPQCNDNVDNDNDGLIDMKDPGCVALTDNDETDFCDGCMLDKTCLKVGIRITLGNEKKYCDSDKQLKLQKQDESVCMNSFECLSNQCSDGKCVGLVKEIKAQTGLLTRILCALFHPISKENRCECITGDKTRTTQEYKQCLAE